MIDFIVVAVLVVIVAAAAFYVYKAKKSGKKCIGCPDGCSCGKAATFFYTYAMIPVAL